MPVDYGDNTNEGPKISEDADPNTTNPFSILKNVGADYLTNKTDKDSYTGFCLGSFEIKNDDKLAEDDVFDYVTYVRIEELHSHLPNPFDRKNLINRITDPKFDKGDLNLKLVFNHSKIEIEKSFISENLEFSTPWGSPVPDPGQYVVVKFKDKKNLEGGKIENIFKRREDVSHINVDSAAVGLQDQSQVIDGVQRGSSSSTFTFTTENRTQGFGTPLTANEKTRDRRRARFAWKRIRKYKDFFIKEGNRIGVDPYILMGIAANESGGKTFKFDKLTGDAGRAYGMMQVNEVAGKGKWRNLVAQWKRQGATPQGNIAMGATVLGESIKEVRKAYRGKKFGDAQLSEGDIIRIGIANYNASFRSIRKQIVKGQEPDNATSGHSYSRSAIEKSLEFKKLDSDGGSDVQ